MFDSCDGRRWSLAFDGGDGRQLWQRWTIETAFNCGGGGGVHCGGSSIRRCSVRRQQRLTAFDGVGDGLQQDEDERAAQGGQATQQPASTMRGQEGGATRGRQEMMARQPAGATREREAAQQEDKVTRGWHIKRQCNNQPAR